MQGVQSQLALAGRMFKHMHPRRRRLPNTLAPQFPNHIVRSYQRDLVRLISDLYYRFHTRVWPTIMLAINDQEQKQKFDDVYDDVRRAFENLRFEVEEEIGEEMARSLAGTNLNDLSRWNRRRVEANAKRVLEIVPYVPDTRLGDIASQFLNQNANLITSMVQEGINKTETLVNVAFQQGKRAEVLSNEVFNLISPHKTSNIRARANLIARDQIAKLNGQLTRTRQTDLGVSRYIWRTMGDARVRDEHQDLNGKIFSWDSPPDVGHPGDDYQCRCYADPVLSDLVPGMEESSF